MDMLQSPLSIQNGPYNPRILRQPLSTDICTCYNSRGNTTNRNPLHCLDCYLSRDFINKRHNLVRNILIEFIRKACRGALVESEPNVEGYSTRPDIQIFRGGRTTYIDVVISNPSCPTHITNNHSDTITDAANLDKERFKTNHYRNWNVPVIPFAIEATGRLGPSALKYISSITKHMGKGKAFYLQEIQCAIAKLNGQMFSKFIRGLRISGSGVQEY
jgi:hypothetical protein